MRPSFLILLAALLTFASHPLFAQDAGDVFLDAYQSYQAGEKAEAGGDLKKAAKLFTKTGQLCETIQQRWPQWNPEIVRHRRTKSQERIAQIGPKVGPITPDELDVNQGGPLPTTEPGVLPPDNGLPVGVVPSGPGPRTSRPVKSSGDPIKDIQDKMQSLEAELNEKREQLAKEQTERREIETKLKDAEKRAETATDAMTKAQNTASVVSEKLSSLVSTGKKNETEIALLRTELDKAKKDAGDAQIQRQAADELRGQLADRLTALSKQRTDTSKLNAEGEKRLKAMQAELDKAGAEKQQLTDKLRKTEEQLQTVQGQLKAANTEIGRMKETQKRVDEIIAERDKLKADLVTAEQTIARYKAEGTTKDQEIVRLRGEVASVRQELTAVQKQSADYQRQMTEFKTKLELQGSELSKTRGELALSTADKKKLIDENEVLRGVVVRQMKEQARRDQMKKIVLGELKKLDLESKALVNQIEILGSPVVKLSRKELDIFKRPTIQISETEISISAAKDTEEPTPTDATVPSPALPAATPVATTNPPPAEPMPAEPAPAKPIETPAANVPPVESAKPAKPTEPAPAENPPAETKMAKLDKPIEGELPSKLPGETTAPPAATPTVEAGSTVPAVPSELLDQAREAKDYFERANYSDAEKIYTRMLTKAPTNVYVLSNLGVVLFRSGKLKRSEEMFKKSIAIAPEDSFSHCTLGIVYYSQGKYDEAVNSLTKALAINPKNATAHNYLGITASQKGWQEAAHKELETAIQIDPNYADAWFNMAVIHATQQPPNKEKARESYKKATSLGAEADAALEALLK